MAPNIFRSVITYLSFFSFLSTSLCRSFNPKHLLNVSKAYQIDSSYDSNSGWAATDATWYGGATAAGSDGGSCGYEKAVDSAPFNSLITAVAPSLYNLGCGLCYQVKCTSSVHCSGNPVTVIVTDSCPGCDHLFDLSGTSFGAMANNGDADSLRNVGRLEVQYKSVGCDFGGVEVTFRVEDGSSPYYFAMAVEFEDGSGVSGVSIKRAYSSDSWMEMSLLWGAVYMVNFPSGYPGPYSVQLTDGSQTIVAENVIPAAYNPGQLYQSTVNFNV